jgi:hypothetical protein
LAVYSAPLPKEAYTEADPSRYTSMMLRVYLDLLDQRQAERILDVGPVCQENIRFFARRIRRVYVCDMFLRLAREWDSETKRPREPAWRHLDYSPDTFDGIQLWDLPDHLDNECLQRLAGLCHTMLKSGGMVALSAFDSDCAPPEISSFVVEDSDLHVRWRAQSHLKFPWQFRQIRELTALMQPLTTANSFRYRNGIREFIFRKS